MDDAKQFPTTGPTAAGSIVMVIVHGVLWAGLLVLPLLYVVPKFVGVYADFGISVPTMTRWVFAASGWIYGMRYVVPFLLLVLLVIDGAVHFQLRREPATQRSSRTWFAMGVLVPLLAFMVSLAAIGLPMIALIRELSKR